MTEFEKNLKHAFLDSQYDLVLQNQKTDLRYQQITKEHTELFDVIRNKLGKKNGKLMFKLEEMENERHSVDNHLIYMQGMLDCVIMLKTIKLI